MLGIFLKTLFAVTTGFVGGYVHHGLGTHWGLALLAGYGLGYWLAGHVR